MRRPGIICIHLPECREPLSLRVSLRLASCGDRGVPAGTCFENEVRQIDACFRPASLMATAPTNSSDSWEVRHVPGVDDASVPCPLISRCEEHSAHICCRHAFLPPSFLLSPVRVSCPERTFLKVRASEHGQAQSQHSETRRACSLFLASQSSFLFLRHFPLDKARVVQGSTRSLPTHGKAPLPSLSAERVGWRGSLVRYMRDGNERKDRNCARAVCSS